VKAEYVHIAVWTISPISQTKRTSIWSMNN